MHRKRLFHSPVLRRRSASSTYMVPMVAVALVWSKLYSPSEGPINQMLGWIGFAPYPWLSRPDTALYSLVILNVWQQTGYFTVLAAAGLTGLSTSMSSARPSSSNCTIQVLRDLGYLNVGSLKGGLQGWLEAGGLVESSGGRNSGSSRQTRPICARSDW